MGLNMTKESSKMEPSIYDFSGHNWDEAAINALRRQTEAGSLGLYGPPGAIASLVVQPATHQPSTSADMSHCELSGSNLSHADLRNANLNHANLSRCRLEMADLSGADLRGADLRAARLESAQLDQARLYGALFDPGTRLPFDKESALRKGMIFLELSSETEEIP